MDILPIADDNDETARLADMIEGVAGEFSPFEALHGFSIDGVDVTTSALPEGWRDRLVKVQNVNTAAPAGDPQFTGWCLDKEDLCVAKLCALREKDRNFVAASLPRGWSTCSPSAPGCPRWPNATGRSPTGPLPGSAGRCRVRQGPTVALGSGEHPRHACDTGVRMVVAPVDGRAAA